MSALILKDFLVLKKQSKIFFLMILFFAIIPDNTFKCFATMYSVMLPVTAIAYDESVKWDSYAVMLPYSTNNIVLEKYILSCIFVLCATVLCIITSLITSLLIHTAITSTPITVFLIAALAALLLNSINLPLIFGLGVEKGRYVYLFLTIFAVVLVGNHVNDLAGGLSGIPFTLGLPLLALAVVLCNVCSFFASAAFYRKRHR